MMRCPLAAGAALDRSTGSRPGRSAFLGDARNAAGRHTAGQVRSKIVNVLMSASGKSFSNLEEANRFIDHELYFAAGASGGKGTSLM